MPVNNWNRKELLSAFNLYCRTPFGKLHKSNPDVIALAQKIGRTSSSVAMKLVNFASLDPIQQSRNIRGLSNVSRADRQIWDEFNANAENLAFESQQAIKEFFSDVSDDKEEFEIEAKATETFRLVRTRLVQGFFREAVLTSYEFKCAICAIDLLELINASHIIPWSHNVIRRADPRNGLALCAIHDRAFDRGLISIDSSFQLILASQVLASASLSHLHAVAFLHEQGKKITFPKRFAPDPDAFAYHRKHIFRH